MKKNIFAQGLFLLTTLGIPFQSYADCHANIYNDSDQEWKIQFNPSDNSNVYFFHIDPSLCENHDPSSGSCTIPANSKIDIHYYTRYGDHASGKVSITSLDNSIVQSMSYAGEDAAGVCPSFDTDNIKNVIVNEPNPGDFRITPN